MRRTKEWWSRLTKQERRRVVELEQGCNSGYGTGGWLPDDCSECSGCGQPMLGIGLCSSCLKELISLIEKATNDKPVYTNVDAIQKADSRADKEEDK